MPNHVHLLITPAETESLSKCVQLVKGGYSFSVRSLTPKEIWHNGYHEHRVRDLLDYDNQLKYIANNPAAARLPRDYRYVHTHPEWRSLLDACPLWLMGESKP